VNILSLFKKITTFIFDVDGVLTDGTLLIMENGLQARRMHVRDGLALQMAMRHGYKVKIISGGNSPEVQERLNKLGVTDISMSVLDKKKFIADYINAHDLDKETVLFMGDDLPDIPAMGLVGLPCCPADAVNEVKEMVRYISPLKGGSACVRDVIEKVLKLNDKWGIDTGIASA
jgi:3-deoxy-D-manno-octulosonate 8-phosphate phosphatase (KDO 8-P phosphatase)